ncbi:MAG: acetylornithine transaminase [Rhodobacterales bacterium]|jgi:acetylornithine/N-succinyldiaminopimelate aminotransferase|tara:strand:+ start:11577 stop:12764 length:1188 start_codon:yes stop_codon:yes gene_type:complete
MMTPVLPNYSRAPLRFVKGEGCWLFDEKNNRYLDLGAGIAVTALGHAHPELVAAIQEQATKLWHVSNLYEIPNQEELAERLVSETFSDTVFFTNSGAESMECAIKMARKYWFEKGEPNRSTIITFDNAFHGRTMATISAVGSEKLTKGFGPLLPGFIQIPIEEDNYSQLKNKIQDPDVAAIIVEPIQGEGGIIPLSDDFLKVIRNFCDQTGVLLIFDEIQCGVGRTGKLFAHEWAGVYPDIMAIAKGIGNGFPLGACLATEEAASGMTAGTHGSTYGGNPLACAVGLKVLDIVSHPDFLADVSRKAGFFRQKLESLIAEHSEIFELVRGEGLMLGMKCKVPNMDVVAMAYKHNLLLVPGGDNVIRLLPALNISEVELTEAFDRLEQTALSLEATL